MLRYMLKFVVYYVALLCFMLLGLLPASTSVSLIFASAVLATVNTFIRPVLVVIALPLNFLTFGIASVFANLLSLVISNGIVGGIITTGFWVMLLIAFVIMLIDDGVRTIREAMNKKHNNNA